MSIISLSKGDIKHRFIDTESAQLLAEDDDLNMDVSATTLQGEDLLITAHQDKTVRIFSATTGKTASQSKYNSLTFCYPLAEWLGRWAILGVITTTELLGGRGFESHSRHE